MYVNASDVPWIAAMRKAAMITPSTGAPRTGPAVYADVCASCHGADRSRRQDRAPSLVGVGARLSTEQIAPGDRPRSWIHALVRESAGARRSSRSSRTFSVQREPHCSDEHETARRAPT